MARFGIHLGSPAMGSADVSSARLRRRRARALWPLHRGPGDSGPGRRWPAGRGAALWGSHLTSLGCFLPQGLHHVLGPLSLGQLHHPGRGRVGHRSAGLHRRHKSGEAGEAAQGPASGWSVAPTLAPSPMPILSLPRKGAPTLPPCFPFLKPCKEALPSYQARCVSTSPAHFSACLAPRALSLLIAFPERSSQVPQLGHSSGALERGPDNPPPGPSFSGEVVAGSPSERELLHFVRSEWTQPR